MNKGKEEGMRMKNIIAVAVVITVVMAIVVVAFSSTASATLCNRTYTLTGGNINYTGGFEPEPDQEMAKIKDEKTGEISNVYAGEKIRFLKLGEEPVSVTVSGPYTKDKAEEYSGVPHIDNIVDAGEEWDSEGKPTKGYYRVENYSDLEGGWFQLMKQSFSVELGEKREKVREGETYTLRIKDNNKKQGVMKLSVEDDEGFSIMNVNGTDIYEVLVAYKKEREFVGFADNKTVEGIVIDDVEGISITKDKELVFDTSKLDMEEGKYKIILEDSATEEKDDVKIEVEKRYLKVECDDVIKGKDLVIIIKSSFYEEEANVTIEGIYEKKKVTLDEDGKKKVKVPTENVDYGTYKVTVEVCDMKETEYVTVKKGEASLEVPENATVGDIISISGTSDYGDFAVFLVDDIFKSEARISDDKFEWDWDTSGELDGYREIEVFIVNESELSPSSIGERVSEDWQREEGIDASATIFLFLPTFSMTGPKNIAKGDDVVISGSAIGTDHVYIIAINYKGEVVFPPGGNAGVINARTTPVEEGKWEENIGELDSGSYVVIALYEGKDGITDAINDDGTWAAGGEGKTLELRVAILMDALTTAGSDDLFDKADFSVTAPKVILKIPEIVEIDDEIPVKAETNIKKGEKAFISLSQNSNSDILKKTFALVENGSVNASINTSGLLPGRYNVAVDICGRASDDKMITLEEKKEEEQEGEEGKGSILQNESLTEPIPEAVEEANESVGVDEMNESQEEEERKIPVNVWDLLIAVVVAVSISIAVKRRRC